MLADSLQLDHSAYQNLDSMIVPCCGELKELKGGHYDKIVEITDNAGKTLLNDYTVTVIIQPSTIIYIAYLVNNTLVNCCKNFT